MSPDHTRHICHALLAYIWSLHSSMLWLTRVRNFFMYIWCSATIRSMCILCINALFPIGLDAFAKLRKTTVSFVVPAWPSVCHQETTRIPLDGFSWHLTLENFSKICWNNSGFIKMWLRGTRWFKYDRGWFVCKQAALRSSCATLKEWSQNLHHPSCSG